MSSLSRRQLMLAATTLGAGISSAETTLRVGDAAPDFSLPASNGKTAKLSDYRGRSHVVLAFFPKAFTGG